MLGLHGQAFDQCTIEPDVRSRISSEHRSKDRESVSADVFANMATLVHIAVSSFSEIGDPQTALHHLRAARGAAYLLIEQTCLMHVPFFIASKPSLIFSSVPVEVTNSSTGGRRMVSRRT